MAGDPGSQCGDEVSAFHDLMHFSKAINDRHTDAAEFPHRRQFGGGFVKRNSFVDKTPRVQRAGANHVEHPRVSVRGHAVAAKEFQFLCNDRVHRQRRVTILAGHQSHLDMAAPLAETENRVAAGFAAAQGVERQVRAA